MKTITKSEIKDIINYVEEASFSAQSTLDDIRTIERRLDELLKDKTDGKSKTDSNYDELFERCGLPSLNHMSVNDVLALEYVLRSFSQELYIRT